MWYAPITMTISFIPLLMNRYYDRLLPLFMQFRLLPNRDNKFMNLQVNYSTPCFSQFCPYWSIPGDLWLFNFSLAGSNSEALGSGTSGSAVCISACPTSLTPCTLNSWEKYFLHLATILWESATRSPFSSFTILHLAWYPFLKSLMPLFKSLIFFILLLVSSSSILALRYAFFCSWNAS